MSNIRKSQSAQSTTKRRRTRGEGCIYRDNKRKRWIAQVYIRKHEPIEKISKRTKACLSLHDAQNELERLRLKYHDASFIDAENMATVEWLRTWFRIYSLPNIRPSTAISYRRMVNTAIKSVGSVPLAKLSPLHLQSVINTMTKADHIRTACYFAKVIKMALKQAVYLHLLRENPADKIILPHKKAKNNFTPLSDAEREAILNAKTPLHCWRMIILLELATGLRRGELLGLQWQDFDAKNGTLTVRRALITGLVENKEGELERQTMLSDTKTPSSHRKLYLPRSVCYALNAYYKNQIAARLRSQNPWKNPKMMFTKDDGGLIPPDYFSACFHRAISRTLPKLTFHKLRHDFASRMLNSHEFSAKEIQHQLGHASVKITMDVYAHLNENSSSRVSKWLENTAFPAK